MASTVCIIVKQGNIKFLCSDLGFQDHSIDIFQILVEGVPTSSTSSFKILYTSRRIDFFLI